MVSVKKITTGEQRVIKARKCKDDVKIVDIDIDDSVEEDSFTEETDDNNWVTIENGQKSKAKRTSKLISRKRKPTSDPLVKKTRNVKVAHNALEKELNMAKLYKKRYESCDKELVKIDMKNGSADKNKQKFVKVEYQTGMFEAMKKNMVRVM